MTDRVPAVGGTRSVPAADPVARDYILLSLRLDQHIPGLVDGYFGHDGVAGAGRQVSQQKLIVEIGCGIDIFKNVFAPHAIE